jgi:hypothetical protein
MRRLNGITGLKLDLVVLCHDEPEVFALVRRLLKLKDGCDKVTVLYDPSTPEYTQQLRQLPCRLVIHRLDHDYSAHRNHLWPYLKGDYSFWLDADEIPAEGLQERLKTLLFNLRYPDLLGVFRKNVFPGVTWLDCLRYNWDLSHANVVNWQRGDVQYRLVRNRQGIRFKGALHEHMHPEPHHRVAVLPKEFNLAIEHHKTIERQRASNDRYNRQYSKAENMAGGSADRMIQ